MNYGTVCDGISAVSCAWEPLGFRCAWRSEIAEFPAAVAQARFPGAPNLGDFTQIGLHGEEPAAVDVLVGGTPCQSFSVAGGRAGLDDPRGHLAVEFLLLARRLGARWVVWENVPGVFSSDGGEAFATFLGLMVECGYGVAWRVLDAQFFGVPQRRRRVFAVGYLGDWRPPVAVLLECPSMRRDPRARGKAGTSVAVPAGTGVASGGGDVANTIRRAGRVGNCEDTFAVAHALTAHHGRNSGEDVFALELEQPAHCMTSSRLIGQDGSSNDQTFALSFHATQDPISAEDTTPAISAEPSGAIAVLPIQEAQRSSGSREKKQHGMGIGSPGDPMYAMTTRGDHAVFAFDEAQVTSSENRSTVSPGGPVPTVSANSRPRVAGGMRPRRLTPREVERCFGFPDDYTLIDGASDSARYEALGNSMAVPVMRWIGQRMLTVESILRRTP